MMTVHYGQYTKGGPVMCYSSLKSAAPLRRPHRDPRELGSDPLDPHVRASDAERDATAAMLSDAAAEGYLTPDELDERLDDALAARTVGDLSRLTRDLPTEWQAKSAHRASRATASRGAKDVVRPRIATYLGVMALLVVIWLIAGLTAGAWYPWPIWPALGWGIALVVRARAAARPAELQLKCRQ
jgi:Domain of unknown function (DUF1707)/2TM domain